MAGNRIYRVVIINKGDKTVKMIDAASRRAAETEALLKDVTVASTTASAHEVAAFMQSGGSIIKASPSAGKED